MENNKEVKVIFTDYNSDEFALANAIITKVNLFKSEDKIEINLKTNEFISLNELGKFEKYIRNKFKIRNIRFIISYDKSEEEIRNEVNNKWADIQAFMSQRVPLMRAFLAFSKTQIENNKLIITLNVKGKDFLHKSRLDEKIG